MLKKIVSRFLFPVPVIFEILAIGLFLLWFTRKQKLGKILVTAGTALLLLLSVHLSSAALLRTLERQYHPVSPSALSAMGGKSETYIVVLGSAYYTDPAIDLYSRISADGVVRVLEGVRLCRSVSGCKLILSGGPPAAAETMDQIALSLGVKPEDIILEEHSHDTHEEAEFIKPIIGPTPFFLVTSASHMPRAMDLFRKLGMQPIAAPTDYLAKLNRSLTPDDIFPSYYGLYEAERTVYEYLGIAWEKLRGQI
jgi:uncharacterized SAM-binding protein YcdF (DUF218 family)